jgi:SAM-dependent methyltransferase
VAITRENVRHVLSLLRQGRNPAATVYDSIGEDFFLALDRGWLNLGLWDGDGTDDAEAPVAVRRLVSEVAAALPRGGTVLDVGNGLGAQDPLVASLAGPRLLIAANVTASQLVAGRAWLAEAGARPVNADAVRLPVRDASMDGVISVEAAFHFRSRRRFFAEAFRVLRPGGVLTLSDVPTRRLPRTGSELLAGVCQLRVWGLGRGAAASTDRIVRMLLRAGFSDVEVRRVGERVYPAVATWMRRRLAGTGDEVPRTIRLASAAMLTQIELLWRRGLIDYVLLRAVKPSG